jgi:hypothetical protein
LRLPIPVLREALVARISPEMTLRAGKEGPDITVETTVLDGDGAVLEWSTNLTYWVDDPADVTGAGVGRWLLPPSRSAYFLRLALP